jgi:lipoyl(octanoyl) transferase
VKGEAPSLFESTFGRLGLDDYDLERVNFSFPSENVWVVEKWNWDYLKAHEFQLKSTQIIKEHREVLLLIFCNHPCCFTLGRGLQKNKVPEGTHLVDFDPSLKERLPFPLYEIKRGGGLTFHYPGQWVFYPIINLTGKSIDVYKMMHLILGIGQQSLEHLFRVEGLSHKETLLGLWYKTKKLASIGIAITRFVTYHGMALNVAYDEKVSSALNMVNPCGLPGQTYTDLESILGKNGVQKEDLFSTFHQNYLSSLLSEVLRKEVIS